MKSDKLTDSSGKSTRQKIIAVVFVLVLLFLGWQLMGLLGIGGGTSHTPLSPAGTTPQGPMQTSMITPKPAELPKKPQQLTPEETAMLKAQQETEAKYIAALNELQMLKLSREIAETNQAIASAKLATVTSEKNIVNLLKPPPPVQPPAYAQGLVNPAQGEQLIPPRNQPVEQVNYTVISVSNLRNRWSAVLGYQGNLYQVSVGDVLPADQSVVVAIDKSGVLLEKDNVRKKISMVPII